MFILLLLVVFISAEDNIKRIVGTVGINKASI